MIEQLSQIPAQNFANTLSMIEDGIYIGLGLVSSILFYTSTKKLISPFSRNLCNAFPENQNPIVALHFIASSIPLGGAVLYSIFN